MSSIILVGLLIPVNADQESEISIQKISTGKIFYETFSSSGGTSFDESWNFTTSEWAVNDGKLSVTRGQAFPSDLLLMDGIYEVKTKPMAFGTGEGPELILSAIEGLVGPQSVFDYVNGGKSLRVIIGSDYGNIATQRSSSFSMNTDTWYTMKIAVSGSNMKCYIDGELVFDITNPNITPFPSVFRLTGYNLENRGCWGYWDDVKIWKSDEIIVTNLTQGHKVELCSNSNEVVSFDTVETGNTQSILDVSSLSFPFEGVFKVYSTDESTLLFTSQTIVNIWGGDEYQISGLSIDNQPSDPEPTPSNPEPTPSDPEPNDLDQILSGFLSNPTNLVILLGLGSLSGSIIGGLIVWRYTGRQKNKVVKDVNTPQKIPETPLKNNYNLKKNEQNTKEIDSSPNRKKRIAKSVLFKTGGTVAILLGILLIIGSIIGFIIGGIIVLAGLVMCLTIIGAIIGLPAMIFGGLIVYGGIFSIAIGVTVVIEGVKGVKHKV